MKNKPPLKLQGATCQNRPHPSRSRGQKQVEKDDIEAIYAEHAKPRGLYKAKSPKSKDMRKAKSVSKVKGKKK